jgi:hypothetical protein
MPILTDDDRQMIAALLILIAYFAGLGMGAVFLCAGACRVNP